MQYARLRGWRFAHFRPARTNQGWRTAMTGDTGYPDLTLARGTRLVFLEVKAERGRVSPDQKAWLEALGAVSGVEAMVVRPSTWDEVRTFLT